MRFSNRWSLGLLAITLAACGAREEAPASSATSPAAPAAERPPEAEATTPPVEVPTEAAPTDRCEGLVGGCGGWVGCVRVRPDPTTPGRFVGVGESAGHFYVENHSCNAGRCNEVCTGGSESLCRPGLDETSIDIECSAVTAPSPAHFTCTMIDGVCTQGPDPWVIAAS